VDGYQIGKDIGELRARVEALEKNGRCECNCPESGGQNNDPPLEGEALLSLPWFTMKYLPPHSKADYCTIPLNGECVEQPQITCKFEANTKQEVQNWLDQNCKDAQGKPKKC